MLFWPYSEAGARIRIKAGRGDMDNIQQQVYDVTNLHVAFIDIVSRETRKSPTDVMDPWTEATTVNMIQGCFNKISSMRLLEESKYMKTLQWDWCLMFCD